MNANPIDWGPTARKQERHDFEPDGKTMWCARRGCDYAADAYVHASEEERRAFDEQQQASERAAASERLERTRRAIEERDRLIHAAVRDPGVSLGQISARAGEAWFSYTRGGCTVEVRLKVEEG